MGKTNFKLLRDLVMIYPIQAKTQTNTGLIVTCIDKTTPQEGIVIAVGPGDTNKAGKFIPVEFVQGDRVVFTKTGARDIKYEKDTFYVVPVGEILCKLE